MWVCIATNIISSIVYSLGLKPIINKVRSSAADKLKDGDVAYAKLRGEIIEDLEDIKKKIDGLARKDLLAGYCFLREGVTALNFALDKSNSAEYGDSNSTSTTISESKSGSLNEAIPLAHALQKLINTESERFVSAKKHFTEARQEATRAFCNEALSLPDRIMAAQLRVVSKILECLQDTKTAAASCMLFLEELHNLPAIRETFSTYFKGGMKSLVYKESRLENVKSVLSLKFVISEFVARFSYESPDLRNWPRIPLPTTGETIHPLLININFVTEIFEGEKFQIPENQVSSCKAVGHPICMNSKGQILWPTGDRINVLDRSGEIETFCRVPQFIGSNLEGNEQEVKALAIDRRDNVFVIIEVKIKNCSDGNLCNLFVFDSSGIEQCKRALDFLDYSVWKYISRMSCVVNKEGDIIIQINGGNLYVCDRNGNLDCRLPITETIADLKCVTDQNDIVVHTNSNVFVYTKEGEIKRKITVKDCIRSVIFNYFTSKIEVLVRNKSSLHSILSYSENDEVECLYLGIFYCRVVKFFSHPAGPAGLVYGITDAKIAFV